MSDIFNEKLMRFASSVNSEIDEKIEQIKQQAEAERTVYFQKTEDRVLLECYEKIQKAVRDIESKYRSVAALCEQESYAQVLKSRKALVDKIFDNVKERIIEFTASDKYISYLKKQLENENLTGAVIKISPRDAKYKTALADFSGCTVEEDSDIRLGSLIIFYEDKGIINDKTFDNALEEQKRSFTSKYNFKLSE